VISNHDLVTSSVNISIKSCVKRVLDTAVSSCDEKWEFSETSVIANMFNAWI